MRSGAKVCKSCRSRQELSNEYFRLYFVPYFPFSCMFRFSTSIFECRRILHSNEYLLAKFGFETAENEPCKVCDVGTSRVYCSLFLLPGIAGVVNLNQIFFSTNSIWKVRLSFLASSLSDWRAEVFIVRLTHFVEISSEVFFGSQKHQMILKL